MFRNIVISLILLVTAQTVMAAGATKVAVLDLRRAVTESTAGQEGFGQLKSKLAAQPTQQPRHGPQPLMRKNSYSRRFQDHSNNKW